MSWQALGISREQEVGAPGSVNELLEQWATFIDGNKLIDYNEMAAEKYYKESESVSHSVMSNSVTPWTAALQAPLSMEFSRQEY